MPNSVSVLLLFAAAAVVCFVGYMVFRYRCLDRPVLTMEQSSW